MNVGRQRDVVTQENDQTREEVDHRKIEQDCVERVKTKQNSNKPKIQRHEPDHDVEQVTPRLRSEHFVVAGASQWRNLVELARNKSELNEPT